MSVYKTEGGYRFRVGYHDALGNYKRKYSKLYKLAREARDAEAEFLASPLASMQLETFGEIFQAWVLEGQDRGDKTTTTLEKKRLVSIYFSPLFDKPVNDITPKHIQQLLAEPAWCKLSTSRKNKGLAMLNSIFKFANTYHGLNGNPMATVKRYKKTDAEKLKEQSIYTLEEFRTFIQCIPSKFEEYANFFTLLFFTGARLNEIRSLTFDHVKAGAIKIDRQLDRFGGGFTSVKTKAGRRTVSLPANCIKIIEKQRAKYKAMPAFASDWFVFGGYKPLSDRTIERIKQDTIRNNNLKPIRIHDFRHSHASMLIEAGVNMYKVSKRLGHSSITITMDRYGHLLDTEEDEILKAIETF